MCSSTTERNWTAIWSLSGIGVRPNTQLAELAGIATDNGVLVNEFLETNVPGVFAAGDIARWPDPRAGRIRVEHWVVAQRQGQTAARNMLGAREPFVVPPFFWSNHFDLHIHYVGHGSSDDSAHVSGDLEAKSASVTFKSGDKLTAVASVGRDRENFAGRGGVGTRRGISCDVRFSNRPDSRSPLLRLAFCLAK